tara:strand:+ start:248 stop:457 length:210 start_codon:yes stop_codon:yes gene_type:complete
MSEIELYKFRELWEKFDPLGTKYIPVDRLKSFLEVRCLFLLVALFFCLLNYSFVCSILSTGSWAAAWAL